MTVIDLTGAASQATHVEMARAVAEVAAAVQAAAARPRDEDVALRRLLSACQRRDFADSSVWSYRRGGELLTGATIEFALEALRCWGNSISGSSELSRTPGQSEMIAFAWDLETNGQRRTTFVNPHEGYVDTPKYDDDGGRVVRRLVSPRDIREGNQTVASRVERGQILSMLPRWYVAAGLNQVHETINTKDPEMPFEDERRRAVAAFEALGVRPSQLERRIGARVGEWLPLDLSTLRGIMGRLKRAESTVEREFPTGSGQIVPADAVSTADLSAATPEPPPPDPAAAPVAVDTPGTVTRKTLSGMFARLTELGYGGRSDVDKARRLRLLELLTGVVPLATANDLSEHAAAAARATLGAMTAEDVAGLLAEDDAERARDAAEEEPT